MNKGMIFDIQKFALHDGPGIRTTVFLKGCALRCKWCCNPESLLPEPQLSYDKTRCTNCLRCISVCRQGALQNHKGNLLVDYNMCNACMNCVSECIPDALKVYGWETDAQSVVNEVTKDKEYFKNSGGGITLSGGDPLFQYEFAAGILSLVKKSGIHTCVETAGYCKREELEQVAEFTDLFLFDFKHYDDYEHIKYTRVSNQSILGNLAFLCQKNHKIILRCPIIPGVNNTIEHFRAIAMISNKYSSIQAVEILPFHDWGFHKYEQIGMTRPEIIFGTPREKTAASWLEMLRGEGCLKARLG